MQTGFLIAQRTSGIVLSRISRRSILSDKVVCLLRRSERDSDLLGFQLICLEVVLFFLYPFLIVDFGRAGGKIILVLVIGIFAIFAGKDLTE